MEKATNKMVELNISSAGHSMGKQCDGALVVMMNSFKGGIESETVLASEISPEHVHSAVASMIETIVYTTSKSHAMPPSKLMESIEEGMNQGLHNATCRLMGEQGVTPKSLDIDKLMQIMALIKSL